MFKAFLERRREVDRQAKIVHHLHEFDAQRGSIISAWATIEMALNQANSYGWHYSNKKISAVVPINLQRKIALFEKIHRELLPFAPLRERAVVLLDWIKRSYEIRHWMAHGITRGEDGRDGVWPVIKDEFQRDGSIKTLTRTFTRDEFSSMRYELIDLANKLTAYVWALIDQINEHGLNDARG